MMYFLDMLVQSISFCRRPDPDCDPDPGIIQMILCLLLRFLQTAKNKRLKSSAQFCTLTSAVCRVATNLEYSEISLNMENSGNSVQPQGKIVANKVFSVHHSNILCKTAVDWVNRIIRNRDEVRVRW